MKFPSFIQYNTKDCGPSCLKIISKYYGQEYSLAYLRELCQVSRDGTSISSMRDAVRNWVMMFCDKDVVENIE